MPIDHREIMNLACTLCEDHNIKVTVKESFKGALIAGSGAMIGGILMGPIGLALGATVGGVSAAVMSKNKFVSAVTILHSMSHEKQLQLAHSVQQIISQLDVTDAIILSQIVMGDIHLQKQILGSVVTFLRDEMRMEIID